METRTFGPLGPVSVLTLGGGGLGQVWGETTRDEAVATVRAAVDAGITLLDVAPGYGRGEAEHVVGEAFGGALPAGVRVGTKIMLGDPDGPVADRIDASLTRSLATMGVERADILWLHSNLVPDGYAPPRFASIGAKLATPWTRFVEEVRPAFEDLVASGRIGAWGITGIALPRTVPHPRGRGGRVAGGARAPVRAHDAGRRLRGARREEPHRARRVRRRGRARPARRRPRRRDRRLRRLIPQPVRCGA